MVVAHEGADSVEVVNVTQFAGKGARQASPVEGAADKLTDPWKPFKGVTLIR
jgi:hypothetical protein